MTSDKSISAHVVFPNKTELHKFLGTFKELPLSHHQSGKMEVKTKGRKRHVTLHIKDYAISLFKSAFRDGLLHHWSGQFKVD